MRLLNLPFICLFLTIVIHCNGASVGILSDIFAGTFGKIGKKVKVLFSPSIFEAYIYDLDNMADVVNNPHFKHDLPTVIYIHGWLEDGELEESVMAVRSAYREKDDHNFLAVDWSIYSKWMIPVPYHSSIKKLKGVCKLLAKQLEKIRTRGHSSYKNFYLVGHSLGGQCAGLVGRTVKKISDGQFVIPKIYGLDPAGPAFEFNTLLGVSGFHTISKNDAEYVQIIHTNGGHLGVKKISGHSDFFVNGGSEQAGCIVDICHHQRSWIYFQESVREDGLFLARKCESYRNFLEGDCESNEISFMGYSSNATRPMGTFYLRTHPCRYGSSMRAEGLSHKKFALKNSDGTMNDLDKPFSYKSKLLNNMKLDDVKKYNVGI